MEGKEIIEEQKQLNLQKLDEAQKALFECTKEVMYDKVKYREAMKFVTEGGFKKASKHIVDIWQAHRYLRQFL